MKNITSILLTTINYVFLITLIILLLFNEKNIISNDPLLFQLFIYYILTLIISFINLLIIKKISAKIYNINICYMIWSLIILILLWIIL